MQQENRGARFLGGRFCRPVLRGLLHYDGAKARDRLDEFIGQIGCSLHLLVLRVDLGRTLELHFR